MRISIKDDEFSYDYIRSMTFLFFSLLVIFSNKKNEFYDKKEKLSTKVLKLKSEHEINMLDPNLSKQNCNISSTQQESNF
jgi:hypothetical protein